MVLPSEEGAVLRRRDQSIEDLIRLVAETKRKVSSAANDLEVLTHELRRRLEEGDELEDDDDPVG